MRASFDFGGTLLPEVIGVLERDHGIRLAVLGAIPVEHWAQHRVTLRMADVTRRAFLDWLVRPLGVEYAVEEGGEVWLTRDDDLLATEPFVLRTYTVPTHVRVPRPVRGTLDFAKEQRLIVDTLEQGLRYLLDRRQGCRIAFHGQQDILVARLPARGHMRLRELLDALRHGAERPDPPQPSRRELEARLEAKVAADGRPKSVAELLGELAGQAKVNFGWDAARLGSPTVSVPKGEHRLGDVLRAVVAQTKVGRYELEPGHGIWLYLEGQDRDFPRSGGTAWDRAVVRAYDIGPFLGRVKPAEVLDRLCKRVDAGQWGTGLPSAAVFTPTARLIIVHDEAGQERVEAALAQMLEQALLAPPRDTKKKE